MKKSIAAAWIAAAICVIVVGFVLAFILWPSSSSPDDTKKDTWNAKKIAALKVGLAKKLVASGVHATDKQLVCAAKWLVDNYTYSKVKAPGFTLSALDKIKLLEKCD